MLNILIPLRLLAVPLLIAIMLAFLPIAVVFISITWLIALVVRAVEPLTCSLKPKPEDPDILEVEETPLGRNIRKSRLGAIGYYIGLFAMIGLMASTACLGAVLSKINALIGAKSPVAKGKF
jgi:hypothetical protein